MSLAGRLSGSAPGSPKFKAIGEGCKTWAITYLPPFRMVAHMAAFPRLNHCDAGREEPMA